MLHLFEHAAYNRIEAARAARQFPAVLERLADGWLTLTAVRLLAPHLTPENHLALLDAARHRSKHDVERLVATIRPKPDVPATIRKLPAREHRRPVGPAVLHDVSSPSSKNTPESAASMTSPPMASSSRPSLQPLAPARYKVQFTLGDEGVALLRRARALVRHRIPDGDMAAIVTEGLKVLVERLERTKVASTSHPRTRSRECAPRSRTIPAAVRRAVWTRDEGRCAFVGTQGRCTERACLEFHHVRPFADGGAAVVENIELRCRAHNQYEAEQHFGARFPWMAREVAGRVNGATRSGTSPDWEAPVFHFAGVTGAPDACLAIRIPAGP